MVYGLSLGLESVRTVFSASDSALSYCPRLAYEPDRLEYTMWFPLSRSMAEVK